jgi:hypothetical protein
VAGLSTQLEEFRELETALGQEHNLVVIRTKLARDRGLRNIRSEIDRLRAMSTALLEELRRTALCWGRACSTSLRRSLRGISDDVSGRRERVDERRRLGRGGRRWPEGHGDIETAYRPSPSETSFTSSWNRLAARRLN